MSDKVQFPVVENGYDVTATDTYIELLQSEYSRVCSWGESLEKRVAELENGGASSAEVEKLRAQNRSLYNNCIVFAKYIKSLEKLRNEQSKFIDAEVSVAENRKNALEQEIADIEDKKRSIEAGNNAARNKADEIIHDANIRAGEIISAAKAESAQIIQNAEAKAAETLRSIDGQAEAKISEANAEAVSIIQGAKNRADDLLREWMDKMSVICSEIDNLAPKSE